MKKEVLKVIKLIAFWGGLMLVSSFLQIFLTEKQLLGLILFIVLLIDYRTGNMYELLQVKSLQLDKIHIAIKQIYKDTGFTKIRVQEVGEKLSNIENKASEHTQTKKFTLED